MATHGRLVFSKPYLFNCSTKLTRKWENGYENETEGRGKPEGLTSHLVCQWKNSQGMSSSLHRIGQRTYWGNFCNQYENLVIWWLIYVIISLSIYCCWVCPKEGDLVMTIFSVSNCHLVLLLIIFFRSLLYCLICNLHPCYVTQSSSRVC